MLPSRRAGSDAVLIDGDQSAVQCWLDGYGGGVPVQTWTDTLGNIIANRAGKFQHFSRTFSRRRRLEGIGLRSADNLGEVIMAVFSLQRESERVLEAAVPAFAQPVYPLRC